VGVNNLRLLSFILAMFASLSASPIVNMARADAFDDLKVQIASVAYADGVLKFNQAVETLGQSLYRYGLEAPQTRDLAMILPVMRMPVPTNPNPEKIDYQAFRKILETLVIDLDASEAALASAGEVEAKLNVNLTTIGYDFNLDGKRTPDETLPAILTGMLGPNVTPSSDFSVKFDTADIYWLRGYGRFISGFAQFLLAHDFEDTFNKTFQIYFPRSGLAVGEKLRANRSSAGIYIGSPEGEGTIADAIAFIHLINWPTVEAARLDDARKRWSEMADLSPKSWAAARKETDNDREWLPNAKQTQAITGSVNSDETINAWLAVMTEFKEILDGKKLMPHWRFDKGLNMKRFFTESKSFDLVLMITGTDAVQYAEDGPVSTSARWNELMSAFQGNFLGYAVWYN
jgi:hypothetical protein